MDKSGRVGGVGFVQGVLWEGGGGGKAEKEDFQKGVSSLELRGKGAGNRCGERGGKGGRNKGGDHLRPLKEVISGFHGLGKKPRRGVRKEGEKSGKKKSGALSY